MTLPFCYCDHLLAGYGFAESVVNINLYIDYVIQVVK